MEKHPPAAYIPFYRLHPIGLILESIACIEFSQIVIILKYSMKYVNFESSLRNFKKVCSERVQKSLLTIWKYSKHDLLPHITYHTLPHITYHIIPHHIPHITYHIPLDPTTPFTTHHLSHPTTPHHTPPHHQPTHTTPNTHKHITFLISPNHLLHPTHCKVVTMSTFLSNISCYHPKSC